MNAGGMSGIRTGRLRRLSVTQEQELGNSYYIVGEKNGYYELVQADSKSVGKPKGLFGFLYSARRHFKDSKSLTYIGWMPKSKLLLHNHAFVSVENHRPLRYCVGISDIKRLYGLHHFLKGDSLSVFADPGLKQALPQKIVMGEFVYIYKVDDTKRWDCSIVGGSLYVAPYSTSIVYPNTLQLYDRVL